MSFSILLENLETFLNKSVKQNKFRNHRGSYLKY